MLELGPCPRFLITRLSAIGDCIHCTPIATALRQRYPKAFIAWITQGGPATLLQGHTDIDSVVTVNRSWIKQPSSVSKVRRELRNLQFDVSIDPQSLTKSSALGWLSGARHRIGFARGQARELSPWLNNHLVKPTATHVVDRYLELLKPLGIESDRVDFSIPSKPAAAETVNSFLVHHQLHDFVLLNPGAGWNSKLWPHERYAEVATYLQSRCALKTVVLWAGERERSWAEQTAKISPAILAPDTSLPELAELCRRARMFVGSDTGPMHLAAAVGTPCVAMFGPTRPEVCGPYGDGHQSLQVYLQDGSSSERRGDDNSAMRAITVEMVTRACEQMVGNRAA